MKDGTNIAPSSQRLISRVERVAKCGELARAPCATGGVSAQYLEMLHDGMRVHFGDASPRCCTSRLSVTSPAAKPLSQTQPIPIVVVRNRAMDGREDTTSIDPVDVLREWPT